MAQTVIDTSKRGIKLNLKEILEYKELLYMLAYRDFRVKYAQTALGLVWGFLQPLLTLIIFVLLFNKALDVQTGEVPYAVFALAGLSAWNYFSYIFSNAGTSIVGSAAMIQKIYFPRMLIPLSKAIVGFVDFGITLLFMIILMVYYQYVPSSNIIYLPLFFIINVITGLAIGFWLSALSIRYRDFQHIIPFMVRLGLWITPVAYPTSIVPEKYHAIYHILNPMAGVVEGFRWSLVGGEPLSPFAYVSFAIIIVLFITSLFFFKRVERVMADII